MLELSFSDLQLPLLQAPMFRVSSDKLTAACAEAGIVGAFQLANPRTTTELAAWLENLVTTAERRRAAQKPFAPICVNVNAGRSSNAEYAERIDLCEAAKVPLVLSSTGDPMQSSSACTIGAVGSSTMSPPCDSPRKRSLPALMASC